MASETTAAFPPAGFSERLVEVGGFRLHYVRGGAGAPLVLIHGWPQTWYEWRLVMPTLAERYDVIVPSLRGLCGSSQPSPDAAYDAATMADDVHGLLQSLDVGPANIVGHDIGMLVAHAYAANYPQDVLKLVIMEGVLIGLEPMTTDFSRFPRAWNFGFNMTPDLPERLTAGRERMFFDYFYDYISARPEAITEEARAEYARAYCEPGAMKAGFEWYRAFPQDMAFIVESRGRRLKMPVLAVGGEACMGDFMAPMLRQVADDVRGHSLEGCGHYPPEEKPRELAELLLDFLQ